MPCRSAIFSAAQPTREALARTGRGPAPRPPVWSWEVRRPAVAKRGSENVAAASPDGRRRALAQGIRQRDGGVLLRAAACDQRGPDEGAGTAALCDVRDRNQQPVAKRTPSPRASERQSVSCLPFRSFSPDPPGPATLPGGTAGTR
jgi:hypothetical protein